MIDGLCIHPEGGYCVYGDMWMFPAIFSLKDHLQFDLSSLSVKCVLLSDTYSFFFTCLYF